MKADYIGGIRLRLPLDKDQPESLTGLVVEMLAQEGVGEFGIGHFIPTVLRMHRRCLGMSCCASSAGSKSAESTS
jgi:hypothetical protein